MGSERVNEVVSGPTLYLTVSVFVSRDLSLDEEFVDELRTNIRFLASVLFRRMKKVGVSGCSTIILLLPWCVQGTG